MALPQVAHPTYELEIPSSGKTLKYRPFLVKEEKVLLLALESNDEKQIENAVKNLLKGCIQTRGIKVEEMPMFDLEYIFLNIRAVSVGEVVDMTVTCRDDNTTTIPYKLDLTKIKVTKPEGHSNKIMISDNMGFIMKYPSFPDFVRNSIIGKPATNDNILEIIASCIDQLFDGDDVYDSSTTTQKEFTEFLEGLTNLQLEKLQEFFSDVPRLEHTFSLKNPNTGVESEYTITGLANFFG
jgi:T4 bacteriophage base plate protein